jgi:hypothetical protein
MGARVMLNVMSSQNGSDPPAGFAMTGNHFEQGQAEGEYHQRGP